MKYVIESLEWSNTANFNGTAYWGPNNSGYTTDLNYAGLYTEEQVRDDRDYYDNHRTTKAVPYDVVAPACKKQEGFNDVWKCEKNGCDAYIEVKSHTFFNGTTNFFNKNNMYGQIKCEACGTMYKAFPTITLFTAEEEKLVKRISNEEYAAYEEKLFASTQNREEGN